MITAEPYPTPPPGIPNQVTSYLTGLIPAGVLDSGAAVVLTGLTVILVAVGHRHAHRGNWCSGWVSGPVAIITALIAASYGASGLPDLAGVSPGDADPRTILVEAATALAAAVLIAGATWPVAMHVAAVRGSPISLPALRDWVQTQRLHAGGGAAAGVVLAWIVDPMLCVAGAVLGLLVTELIEHLRGPVVPVTPAAPRDHRVVPAPVPGPTPISDEW